jgi:predicted Zn-dependent protease
LKLVRVGRPLPSSLVDQLGRYVLEAFRGVVRDFRIVQYDPPDIERIEAGLLTMALEAEVGGHILGITEADLVESDGTEFHDYMFGGKDERNSVAVVSTRRLVDRRGDLPLDRVVKVGLHELGHNFGLGHHYSFERTGDGGYCPMSKGDYNGYGERGYLRAVVDGRGFRFCRQCRRLLRRFTGRRSRS